MTIGLKFMVNRPPDIENRLIQIVQQSVNPLSTRDISTRLRAQRVRMPNYEINRHLRNLVRNDIVIYHRGLWEANNGSKDNTASKPRVVPPLKPEVLRILDWDSPIKEPFGSDEERPSEGNEEDTDTAHVTTPYIGRWANFRRLLAYYRKCIINEEGADASAFHNQLFERFIYLQGIGPWYPKAGMRWHRSIPLGPHLAPFLNALSTTIQGQTLVLGYPVQGVYIQKEGEPDTAIIRPIFFFPLEHLVSTGAIVFTTNDSHPDINLGWLEHTFSRNPNRQRSFLSACGFINRFQPNDEMPMAERGECHPSLDNLARTLSAYLPPERVQQPLCLDSVSDKPLSEPFKTGIYNRAVIMLARRTNYTQTLLKELAAIEKVPDEELDRTALRHIFLRRDKLETAKNTDARAHEEIVADTTLLNAEQRRAVASLLTNDVTVVTGPPGTGKSQVVCAAAANARIKGQSLLFVSRNHKAIDAVFGRLKDQGGRSLMVRTNSKDDPNLNYTFGHAIKEMLAMPYDISAGEQLARAKDQLTSMLKERGRKACYANAIADLSLQLGEKEERMAYLSDKLSGKTVEALNEKAQSFPIKSMQRIIEAISHIQIADARSTWLRSALDFFRYLWLQPRYLKTRYALRPIPEIPTLPMLGMFVYRMELLHMWPILESAMEFSRLRLECFPLEEKTKKLPPLEQLTGEIAELSSRIAEVVPRILSLDMNSRSGLPSDTNREELNGLQAAIRAMRTGLAEGVIRNETKRVLKERAPMVLKHFPCWAVTNLSAGTRIPLVPGLFDMAIVDEASQSDIPSAIPILFRARRAGVVGDPFQLTHCSKLSTSRDTMLRRSVGIKQVEDVRFAYTESSLYDLFASTNYVEPIFLSETYRSATAIAGYSNHTFYSGRLRVATNQEHLSVPSGMKVGIHWTDVRGSIQSGGGSGCYCQEEVETVLKLVRNILVDNDFQGSIGVIAPFRQQANRLQDAIFDNSVPYDRLTQAKVHVDTAHGFQGDERDVIIFSLCAGPDMPHGSRTFIRETGNLFNVAVSRTRAVLHVIGNHDWAKSCGIKHVQNLAAPPQVLQPEPSRGPWHPHESPWEKNLYEALVQAGLDPIPQFPVLSRRLDLALIRRNGKSLKIDIEVDGDCHRNPDGSRKIDDIWRDIQLQGTGWKVMRFWVYQLRENMDDCVKKIVEVYNKNARDK